jgi:hypothetical protein
MIYTAPSPGGAQTNLMSAMSLSGATSGNYDVQRLLTMDNDGNGAFVYLNGSTSQVLPFSVSGSPQADPVFSQPSSYNLRSIARYQDELVVRHTDTSSTANNAVRIYRRNSSTGVWASVFNISSGFGCSNTNDRALAIAAGSMMLCYHTSSSGGNKGIRLYNETSGSWSGNFLHGSGINSAVDLTFSTASAGNTVPASLVLHSDGERYAIGCQVCSGGAGSVTIAESSGGGVWNTSQVENVTSLSLDSRYTAPSGLGVDVVIQGESVIAVDTRGVAYLYARQSSGGWWLQKIYDGALSGGTDNNFRVGLSGSNVLIGLSSHDGQAAASGAVFIFGR